MSTFSININNVYVFVIEPILCFIYAFILICIINSPNKELHTPYYTFFVAVGIAGIANVIVVFGLTINGQVVVLSASNEYPCAFFSFVSYVGATAHTFGKFATLLTRFTAIIYENDRWWTTRRTRRAIIIMFITPSILFFFFLIIPFQSFMTFTTWQTIAKGFTTTFYAIYLSLSIPISIWCISKLHRFSAYNKLARRQEVNHTIYAITSTLCHMGKGLQQVFWMYAIVTGNAALNAKASTLYTYVNTLALLSPPVLLVLSSPELRRAILSRVPFTGVKEDVKPNSDLVFVTVASVNTKSAMFDQSI